MLNDYSWLGKKLTMCDRDELLKALQYYEVTLSWQRKANKNIIAEIKKLLIEKSKVDNAGEGRARDSVLGVQRRCGKQINRNVGKQSGLGIAWRYGALNGKNELGQESEVEEMRDGEAMSCIWRLVGMDGQNGIGISLLNLKRVTGLMPLLNGISGVNKR